MSKLIGILVVLAVVYFGWHIFMYYEKVSNEKEAEKKEAAAAVVVGDQLPGMPSQLEASLQTAREQGAIALTNWLKTYNQLVQDPRRAWIDLDYCILISRANPAEARRIFAAVKERTPPSSPVWPRIKQLQATYE